MNDANDNDRNSTSAPNYYMYCEGNSERDMVKQELAEATDPLSPEEEREAFREMIQAAIDGDDDRRRAIRERIFRANIRLAYYMAAKVINMRKAAYGEYASSLIDLAHVGYDALYRAMDKFDVERGNRFSTYAGRAIQNEIYMFDGIRKRHEHGVGPMKRLDKCINPDDDTTWRDMLEDENCTPVPVHVYYRDKAEKIRAQLRSLSDRDLDIVSVKLGLDGGKYQLRDMARKHGITPARASQIATAAIDKLLALLAA